MIKRGSTEWNQAMDFIALGKLIAAQHSTHLAAEDILPALIFEKALKARYLLEEAIYLMKERMKLS